MLKRETSYGAMLQILIALFAAQWASSGKHRGRAPQGMLTGLAGVQGR